MATLRETDVLFDDLDIGGGYYASNVGGVLSVQIDKNLTEPGYRCCVWASGVSYRSDDERLETPDAAKKWIKGILRQVAEKLREYY